MPIRRGEVNIQVDDYQKLNLARIGCDAGLGRCLSDG